MNTARGDTENCPADRVGIRCLQCGTFWMQHDGWQCPSQPAHRVRDALGKIVMSYYALPATKRYTTPDMLPSPVDIPPLPSVALPSVKASAPTNPTDVSDWRSWRSSRPGECPCGSSYGVCSYHPKASP